MRFYPKHTATPKTLRWTVITLSIWLSAIHAVAHAQPAPTSRPGTNVHNSSGAGEVAVDPKLDLNTATAEQLATLPGIGPAKAAAIVETRKRLGRFRSVAKLMRVPGIGRKTFARLRSRLTVGPSPKARTSTSGKKGSAPKVRKSTHKPAEATAPGNNP